MSDKVRDNRRHRIAKRAAYLTCGTGIANAVPHGPDRPACLYLEALTTKQRDVEAAREAKLGRQPLCTWYWDTWDLFDDRDAVAHDARRDFDHRKAVRYEQRVDEAILAVAGWASRTGAQTVGDLDAEIEAFVGLGVQDGAKLRPPRRPRSQDRSAGRSGKSPVRSDA